VELKFSTRGIITGLPANRKGSLLIKEVAGEYYRSMKEWIYSLFIIYDQHAGGKT
jgi:hypothetical protein